VRPFVPGLLLLVALASCGDAPPAAPARDPYAPEVAATAPSGPPVEVTFTQAAGDAFRTTGTLRYRRVVTGKAGPGLSPSELVLEGTVDLRSRTESGDAGTLAVVVEGRIETVELAAGPGARRRDPRADPFLLRFTLDEKGRAVHRSIRLTAPASIHEALEVLQAAFTEPLRFPTSEVRVGQWFPPMDVLDLDQAMRRPLFFLFVRRAQMGQPAGAPILGRVWIEAREEFGGTDVVRTRLAVTHAFEGDTDVPKPTKDNVVVGYRAAVEGTVRTAIAGGWSRTLDVTRRRRVTYRATDLDYAVEFEGRATLETVRESP
jgi:hypothetical protein